MQEKKRRSKRGFWLLVAMVALAVMAFVPASAMAEPPAPNVLVPEINFVNYGSFAQGNYWWFGPDYDSVSADFYPMLSDPAFSTPQREPSWTAIPLDAPLAPATVDVGTLVWKVNGLPANGVAVPITTYPQTVTFGDSDSSFFDYPISALPMNDGIYTVTSWLKETTTTANPLITKRIVTKQFGVDNTPPQWAHITGIDEDCFYNIPVVFSAIVSDSYGSGVDTASATWTDSKGSHWASGHRLVWDYWIQEVTGTVAAPTLPQTTVNVPLVLSATDMVGNTSTWPTMGAGVNFDLNAPTTSHSVSPVGADDQSGWTNKPVTVTFQSADQAPYPNAGVDYTEYIVTTSTTTAPPPKPDIDATGTKGTSVVINTTAPIGPVYVWYRSVDKACPTGNKEDWNLVMVFFDDVAPVVGDDTPSWWINANGGRGNDIDGDCGITITASDHNSGIAAPGTTWSIAGHPPFGGTFIGNEVWIPILPLALGDGIRALTYTVTDKAGNTATGGSDIKIDTRGPVTEALVPSVGPEKWINGLVPYVLLATDQVPGAGVAATVYRVDQATPWAVNEAATVAPTLETPITIPGAQGSLHTIDFASVDAALPLCFDPVEWAAMTTAPKWHLGNWELDILNILKTGAAYKSLSVKLDVTAPVVALANPVNPDWQKGPAVINFTGTDVGAGYDYTEWSTDGGTTWSKGNHAEIGGNGVIEVMYRGVDKVGIKSATQTTTVSVATTGPKNAAKNASVKRYKKVTISFKVTAVTPKASVNILIRKDGVTKMTKRYSQVTTNMWVTRTFMVPLAKGRYLIRVDSVDLAGNAQTVRGQSVLTVK
jgi:hypothetical protein